MRSAQIGILASSPGSSPVDDQDAQLFFDEATGLTDQEKDAINNWFIGTKADGNFLLDRFFSWRLDTEASALRSFVNPTNLAVNSGTPGATYNIANLHGAGFSQTGGGGYIDIDFIPNTHGVNYTSGSAFIAVFTLEDTTQIGIATGITDDPQGGDTLIYTRESTGGGTAYGKINGSSLIGTADSTLGVTAIQLVGGNINLWKNGVIISTSAFASPVLADRAFYALCRNENGTASAFWVGKMIGWACGSGAVDQLAFYNRWVTLNSELTASPHTTIVVIIGQSNGTDRGDSANLAAQYVPEQPNVFSFTKPNYTSTDNGDIQKFHAGYNTFPGETDGSNFGLTATLGYVLANTYGLRPLIINCAVGGTPIYQGAPTGWNINDVGNLTDVMLDNFLAPAISKLNGTYDLWLVDVHGESDSADATHAADFYQNKVDQYNHIRATYQSAKFVVCRLKPTIEPTGFPYASVVIQAQNDLGTNLTGVYVHDPVNLSFEADLVHYTDPSHQTNGIEMAHIIGNN